ncbi:MAG: metallophosphoesterase [Stagnimonas sp.]|nr:metallophosphoesterase [Stagnimonas sp.]
MTSLRLAHCSDPHLHFAAPPPRLSERLSKRGLSRSSWARGRGQLQRPEILAQALADLRAQGPDHILVSGDLVNFSLPGEFEQAARWLATLGSPQALSVIPGNHDALVPVPAVQGLDHWLPWMQGDAPGADAFPYVRVRGGVALIGLSSALPTAPGLAGGRLGVAQLQRLESLLADLKAQGLCRVITLHHPPAEGVVPERKALWDRAGFRAVLARQGAELVLHGHSRDSRFDPLPGPAGLILNLGLPSVSAIPNPKDEGARWQLLEFSGAPGHWQLRVTVRAYSRALAGFETAGRYRLKLNT